MEEANRSSGTASGGGWGRFLLHRLFLQRKLFWLVTLLVFAADLWTKDLAISYVRDHQGPGTAVCWVAEPWFGLVDVSNRGGPWGVGRDHGSALKVIRLLALGVILYILLDTDPRHRFQAVSLALVMGGALGNIWDSWILGHVRDFLYFDLNVPPADPWPAFNLADSMICVGVFFLAAGMVWRGMAARRRASRSVGEPPTS